MRSEHRVSLDLHLVNSINKCHVYKSCQTIVGDGRRLYALTLSVIEATLIRHYFYVIDLFTFDLTQ